MQLHISGVSERDLDLLLLEEFVASDAFADWFITAANLSLGPCRVLDARRSVTQSSGESDLEVDLRCGESIVRLLVENKIDANFQPLQPQRYRDRAVTYVATGICAAGFTILVAPSRYLTGCSTSDFDAMVSYEAIREWIALSDMSHGRRRYKDSLLGSAIEKSQLGYLAESTRVFRRLG